MNKFKLFLFIVVIFYGCESSETKKATPTSVIVNSKTYYLLQGDTFEAQIIPIDPELWKNQISFVNEGHEIIEEKWENGVLKVKAKTTSVGMYKLNGILQFNDNEKMTEIPYSTEYIVVKPSTAITNKYLIKDIENPLNVSVTGIPAPLLELTSNDAEIISKGMGDFLVTPKKLGIIKIKTVYKSGNEIKELAESEFEVFEKK